MGADDGVQASVAGYPGGARAVPVAGPAYLYSDGDRADLALYTTSCDITPLVVHKEDYMVDREVDREQDQDQERDSNEEINSMDTLYKVMVSTNLTLD